MYSSTIVSINDLFKYKDKKIKIKFEIPNFQRKYVWGNDTVNRLILDIDEANSSNFKNYFLGNIILSKKNEYYELIDGQQRITTLIFILLKIQEKESEYEISNKNLGIINKILRKSNNYNLEILRVSNEDQTSFNNVIKKLTNDKEKQYDNTLKLKPKKIPSELNDIEKQYDNTLKCIEDTFSSKEINKNDFLTYLFNSVVVNLIICNDESYALKLFEVVNNRGVDLKSSDIIKVYLIQYFKDKKEYVKTQFENWNKHLKSDNLSMDNFFTFFLNYKESKVLKKALHEEFKEYIEKEYKKNYSKLLDDLNNFDEKALSFINRDNINGKLKKYIFSLVQCYKYWTYIYPVLCTIYLEIDNNDDKEWILKKLNVFYYRLFIFNVYGTSVRDISLKIISTIKEIKNNEDLKNELNKLLIEFQFNKEEILRNKNESITYEDIVWNSNFNKEKLHRIILGDNYNPSNVYNKGFLKPLLLSLYYYQLDTIAFIKNDKNLNLDHILPKKFSKNKDWDYIDKKEGNKYLNSLGNLALINSKKNIKASNCSFKEKKAKFFDKTISPFKSTNDLLEVEKWDIENIKNRGNKLYEEIYTFLSLNDDTE